MSRRSGRTPVAPILEDLAATGPDGLVVDVLVDGEGEFAIFTWGADVHASIATLTHAETEVLALVVQGASNAEIATKRGASPRTVANQVASLLRKLDASSRFDLIRKLGGHETRRPET